MITLNNATINVNVQCHPPHSRRGRVVVRFGIPKDLDAQPPTAHQYRRRITEEVDVAKDILTQQSDEIFITAFKDSRGKVVTVDGVPQWSTDDSDKVTLEPAADGMSCKVSTGVFEGTVLVRVTADADRSENVRDLVGTFEYLIKMGEATVIELAAPNAPVDLP